MVLRRKEREETSQPPRLESCKESSEQVCKRKGRGLGNVEVREGLYWEYGQGSRCTLGD